TRSSPSSSATPRTCGSSTAPRPRTTGSTRTRPSACNFPLACAYPRGMRETRDLLRRRTWLVRQRAGLMTHLQILNAQYNLPPFPKKLSYVCHRAEVDVPGRFADPSVRKSAACDLALIDCLDG